MSSAYITVTPLHKYYSDDTNIQIWIWTCLLKIYQCPNLSYFIWHTIISMQFSDEYDKINKSDIKVIQGFSIKKITSWIDFWW